MPSSELASHSHQGLSHLASRFWDSQPLCSPGPMDASCFLKLLPLLPQVLFGCQPFVWHTYLLWRAFYHFCLHRLTKGFHAQQPAPATLCSIQRDRVGIFVPQGQPLIHDCGTINTAAPLPLIRTTLRGLTHTVSRESPVGLCQSLSMDFAQYDSLFGLLLFLAPHPYIPPSFP